MLPCVLCVYWGFHSWWCLRQRGGLHGPLNLAIPPKKMPLTHGCHRPPPNMPDPGIDPTTFQLRDLRLARLSETGILVCHLRGDAVLKRKTRMGLRAACMEKGEGAPAYEPSYLTSGGKRAPLPRTRPSSRQEPLLGGGGGCLCQLPIALALGCFHRLQLCVPMCVTPKSFKSCSNREVQQ